MERPKGRASLRRKCPVLLLRMGIIELIMFSSATSDDQTGIPATGLLCISDCATCPVICSPPPPSEESKPKPPPSPPVQHHHHSPPPPYYFYSPPPSELPAPPPPSYFSWGTAPPPPLPVYPFNPSGQLPPGIGQRNYSYPYYYFYASKGSSLSLHASLFLLFLLSFCVVF